MPSRVSKVVKFLDTSPTVADYLMSYGGRRIKFAKAIIALFDRMNREARDKPKTSAYFIKKERTLHESKKETD